MYGVTDGRPGNCSNLTRNYTAIEKEARYKGFFALASNSILPARIALKFYGDRDCVGKTFTNLQTGVDLYTVGIYLIDTLIICMIALTMVAQLSYEIWQCGSSANDQS